MNRPIIVVGLVCVLVGAGFGYWHFFGGTAVVPSKITSSTVTAYVVPQLTQPYKNTQFNFELSIPAAFAATESDAADDTGGKVIVLQDKKSNGVQITVTPFDEPLTNLTEERIHAEMPDLKITDAQPVEIGKNNTGLAFKSDNAAFDGASREVWFVFRGNLYQISTYERLDPLLVAMFNTWKFL